MATYLRLEQVDSSCSLTPIAEDADSFICAGGGRAARLGATLADGVLYHLRIVGYTTNFPLGFERATAGAYTIRMRAGVPSTCATTAPCSAAVRAELSCAGGLAVGAPSGKHWYTVTCGARLG